MIIMIILNTVLGFVLPLLGALLGLLLLGLLLELRDGLQARALAFSASTLALISSSSSGRPVLLLLQRRLWALIELAARSRS